MEPEEVSEVSPLLSAYSLLSKCKSLGLTVSADSMSIELVDMLHTIQSAVDTVQENQRKARG